MNKEAAGRVAKEFCVAHRGRVIALDIRKTDDVLRYDSVIETITSIHPELASMSLHHIVSINKYAVAAHNTVSLWDRPIDAIRHLEELVVAALHAPGPEGVTIPLPTIERLSRLFAYALLALLCDREGTSWGEFHSANGAIVVNTLCGIFPNLEEIGATHYPASWISSGWRITYNVTGETAEAMTKDAAKDIIASLAMHAMTGGGR